MSKRRKTKVKSAVCGGFLFLFLFLFFFVFVCTPANPLNASSVIFLSFKCDPGNENFY